MAFFKRHKGRGSYDLFSNYNHYLPDLWGVLILAGLFLAGLAMGSVVTFLFISFIGMTPESIACSFLISYPIMFIPAMLYASVMSRRNEFFNKGYALDNRNFGSKGGAVIAVTASIATLAAAFIFEPVISLLPDMPADLVKQMEIMTKGPFWANFVSVAIFAPFFEEWLCRGMILRGLLKRLNPVAAIIISAVFFAVLHGNIWQGINAFALGLLFGYVYYRTGSLKLTMLMHFVNNAFSLLLSRIPALADVESFMDVLSPWAYAGVFASCVVMLICAVFVFRAIPVKDRRMGGCEEVDSLSID